MPYTDGQQTPDPAHDPHEHEQLQLATKKLDGIGGAIAPNSEFLLVATRGAPGRKKRLANAVIARSQTKEHSRKPEVFLDLIESVSYGPYLEMFSRRARFGWDTWGDEALHGTGAMAV